MAKLIRKISVGKDYKNDAMHYAVGQEVYGGHTICDIVEEKDKEVIDLTPKPEKLTENELARLQATVKTVDQLTHEVGTIEVRKHALMKAMESVQIRIEAIRVELKDQYGTDNISIQDGTINHQEENCEANKED